MLSVCLVLVRILSLSVSIIGNICIFRCITVAIFIGLIVLIIVVIFAFHSTTIICTIGTLSSIRNLVLFRACVFLELLFLLVLMSVYFWY